MLRIGGDADQRPGGHVEQQKSWGKHVASRINDAREQIKHASSRGCPGVLPVYNTLDPLQVFGTEQHDFLAGQIELHVSRNGAPAQTLRSPQANTARG